MKLGAGTDDDEQWFSNYINHYRFQFCHYFDYYDDWNYMRAHAQQG